jgi:hypothetical protein
MMKRALLILVAMTFFALPGRVLSCEWEGGKTKLIPGIVEIQRGCCDNDGNMRLMVYSHEVLTGRKSVLGALIITFGFTACLIFCGFFILCFVRRRKVSQPKLSPNSH